MIVIVDKLTSLLAYPFPGWLVDESPSKTEAVVPRSSPSQKGQEIEPLTEGESADDGGSYDDIGGDVADYDEELIDDLDENTEERENDDEDVDAERNLNEGMKELNNPECTRYTSSKCGFLRVGRHRTSRIAGCKDTGTLHGLVESAPVRTSQLQALRTYCVPNAVFMLVYVLQTTGRHKDCLRVADLVASNEHGLYQVIALPLQLFSRAQLSKLLTQLHRSASRLLHNEGDPVGYADANANNLSGEDTLRSQTPYLEYVYLALSGF
ncbi:unnamed protein product [Protopolystoma xenopodis]|uniref:Nuclear pore complex protein n=1 Tax=Protopolystoma xenopodis TaxID=117903 RepID=A0A3S5AGE2_9PLAT|nr:unnamed protein product [Protopolystoma xenopodis]